MTAALTDEQRYKVLRGNAIRMLDLDRVVSGQSRCRPWRQNSQVSSAVTRMRAFSASRLPNQLYITVCWIERAGAPRVVDLDRAGRDGGVERARAACARSAPSRPSPGRDGRPRAAPRTPMIGRRLCVPRLRGVSAGSHHSCSRIVNACSRSSGSVFVSTTPAEVVGRLADRLLEQREQQLVLAVEVLVEAAQRLLRAVDDLLDRELGRALLVDQLERGVEEPLHALLGPRAGRVQAARDRTLAPPASSAPRRTPISAISEPAFTSNAPYQRDRFARLRVRRACRRGRPSSRSARPA